MKVCGKKYTKNAHLPKNKVVDLTCWEHNEEIYQQFQNHAFEKDNAKGEKQFNTVRYF